MTKGAATQNSGRSEGRGRKKGTDSKPKEKRSTKAVQKLSRWSKVGPLGFAMADKGVAGSEAVTYLRHALGVSRSLAYDLLRGAVDIDDDHAKALTPLLGDDAVLRLRNEAKRRILAGAEDILREGGNEDLAKRVGAWTRSTFGHATTHKI